MMGPHVFGWFFLVAIMMTAFLVVGSTRFGFGVGFMFASTEERPYLLQALQPQMDGSSLWVVLMVVALFFLFPLTFGVLFAGFYPVIAFILMMLGFRNVAFGLKGMVHSRFITPVLDLFISIGNVVPLFLIGVMAGYILKGVPLFNEGRFNVSVLGYINHYTVASGLLTVFTGAVLSFCAIAWNSDGKTRVFARKWAFYSALVFCVLIFDLGLWSLVLSPYITSSLTARPVLYSVPALAFIGAVVLPVLIAKWRFSAAYLLAAGITVCLIATFFLTIYPNLREIFIQTNMERVDESTTTPEEILSGGLTSPAEVTPSTDTLLPNEESPFPGAFAAGDSVFTSRSWPSFPPDSLSAEEWTRRSMVPPDSLGSRPNIMRRRRGGMFGVIYERRQKLLPVFGGLMILTAILQYSLFKRYRQFTHCPLPYDEEEEELF